MTTRGTNPAMLIMVVLALSAVMSSSLSSAATWLMRNIEGDTNPSPEDSTSPRQTVDVGADTQAPQTKAYVTPEGNVPQDWTGGKIVYGKCEGAECSSCPAGSMKASVACKKKKVMLKKSCWNPMTNTFSKPVCAKKDGCAAGQTGVVTAADLAKATGPMCPIGSKPVAGNDKVCINPQSMQISGLSTLADIKAYNAAMKGGVKAMTAYYAKKNPSESC